MTLRQEILEGRQRLADAKRRQIELQTEGKGLVQLIRNILHPYEHNVVNYKIAEAQVHMQRLEAVHTELAGLQDRIRDLEQLLEQA